MSGKGTGRDIATAARFVEFLNGSSSQSNVFSVGDRRFRRGLSGIRERIILTPRRDTDRLFQIDPGPSVVAHTWTSKGRYKGDLTGGGFRKFAYEQLVIKIKDEFVLDKVPDPKAGEADYEGDGFVSVIVQPQRFVLKDMDVECAYSTSVIQLRGKQIFDYHSGWSFKKEEGDFWL